MWEDDLLEKLRFIKGKTASGGFAYAPVRVLKSDRDSLLSQRPDSEFLSTPQDFLKAVEEAMVDLARKKLPFHPSPALGAMIELPAVLDIIHELAKEADFFPSGPTTFVYCGTACSIDLHVVDGKVVKITGTEDGVVNKGSLCVKGRFGYDFIHHEDRLTTPLIKENGSLFRKASWDEALGMVASRLKEIKTTYGPDSIGGIRSACCTNEENYLMQKFMRAVMGTNNIDHCARL